jgi:hypothetical protein
VSSGLSPKEGFMRPFLILAIATASCAQTPVTIPNPPVPANVTLPHQVVERFPLAAASPLPPNSNFTINLSKTPATGYVLHISFESTVVGGNYTVDIPPVGPNFKQVIINTPNYRPLTVNDVFAVTYWTTE